MMNRAVNNNFWDVLKTKPDERKQFTKEHILHDLSGFCGGFHLLTAGAYPIHPNASCSLFLFLAKRLSESSMDCFFFLLQHTFDLNSETEATKYNSAIIRVIV